MKKIFPMFAIIVLFTVIVSVSLVMSNDHIPNEENSGIDSFDNMKRVIILYNDDVTEQNVDDLKKKGSKIKNKHRIIPAISAFVEEDEIANIKLDASVKDVVEDELVFSLLSVSVPQIKADQVHSLGGTGSGVKVCIIDTGVDDTHPGLNPLVAEHDFVDDDNDATDEHGHGTWVAGMVASIDPNLIGVAPGASLMAARVLGPTGSGFSSDVVAGIEWCVNNGADIITMSLGGAPNFDEPCEDTQITARAGNIASDLGVVVFAASGNNFHKTKIVAPACGSKIIAVGAIDENDGLVDFSNQGVLLDLVAPGSGITSLNYKGGFKVGSGTSASTPHVAAVGALVLGRNSLFTPLQVKNILTDTSLDLGAPGFDTVFGFGRVDALAAYESISGNQAPVAKAGDDQSVTDIDDNGFETVTLDGSGSFDLDGTITAYEWKEGSTILGITPKITKDFPLGTHSITLTVTDNDNASSSDTVNVNVVQKLACIQGFTLSKDPSFSKDEREFAKTDTIFIRLRGDLIDHNILKKSEFVIRGSRRQKIKGQLTYNLDDTYTGSASLSRFRPGKAKVSIKLEDHNKNKIQLKEDIVITGPDKTDYTIFNDNQVLMLNLDNKSEFGESEFGESDSYVNMGHDSNIDIPTDGEVSMEAWVYPDSFSGGSFVMTKRDLNTIAYLMGFDASGNLFAGAHQSTSNDVLGTEALSLDEWHHVVGVLNGTTGQVYVDGKLDVSDSSITAVTSRPTIDLVIGATWSTFFGYQNIFNGSIDEVRIYNISLDADQVYENYITNLPKYDIDKWTLIVNQNQNSSDPNLPVGLF